MPDHYCNDCAFALCGMCHEAGKAPHSAAHDTVDYDWDNETHMKAPTKDEVDARAATTSGADKPPVSESDVDELAKQVGDVKI